MRVPGLVVVLLLAGCSMYIPQPPDSPPPPGATVRARLTTPGAVRVSGLFGLPVREVEGKILSTTGDSLGLGLLSATQYGRPWAPTDTFRVAGGEILELYEKRIDRTRTALLVGGVGVISGVVIVGLFKAATRGGDGDPSGETDTTLIPLFSIRR